MKQRGKNKMSSYLWCKTNQQDTNSTVIKLSERIDAKESKEQIDIDKYIRCRDCDVSFLFSTEEQRYFKTRGLTHSPRRCHNCRVLRRAQSNLQKRNSVTAIVCISCKSLTYVPFKPKGHSPIYCRVCMHKNKPVVV